MYSTTSGGKDNVSYVVVISDGERYEDVSVVVDGTEFPYGKLQKVKSKRKADKLQITPGQHHLQVKVNGNIVADEKVFIGLQETKRFVVR